MRTQCEEAQQQLQSTNEACKSLIDRAGSLRDERYELILCATELCLLMTEYTDSK
jgi:hypothetical protein